MRQDRAWATVAVACDYSRDPVRIARLAGIAPEAVRRYLGRHALAEDRRVPHDWIVSRTVDPADTVARILTAAHRVFQACGSAHATYHFIWPAPCGAWSHGAMVGSCRHDLTTYHALVVDATVQNARRHRAVLARDGVDGRVLVRRLSVEDGWGRGVTSVPWALLAHPANLRFVPVEERTARYRVDPDTLLRDAHAWNAEHGTALLDASALVARTRAEPLMLRSAN